MNHALSLPSHLPPCAHTDIRVHRVLAQAASIYSAVTTSAAVAPTCALPCPCSRERERERERETERESVELPCCFSWHPNSTALPERVELPCTPCGALSRDWHGPRGKLL